MLTVSMSWNNRHKIFYHEISPVIFVAAQLVVCDCSRQWSCSTMGNWGGHGSFPLWNLLAMLLSCFAHTGLSKTSHKLSHSKCILLGLWSLISEGFNGCCDGGRPQVGQVVTFSGTTSQNPKEGDSSQLLGRISIFVIHIKVSIVPYFWWSHCCHNWLNSHHNVVIAKEGVVNEGAKVMEPLATWKIAVLGM